MNVSRFSAASAAWTKDSDAQASSTGSCARSTTTDDKSSADASRTHRSSETYESSEKDSYGFDWDLDETTARISSAEDSPAKTSASQESAQDSQENEVDSSSSSHASLALFDPDGLSSNGGRDFGVLLDTLADIGFGLAWRVLDSRFFGVPQRRRRVFVVGAFAD